MRATRTIYSAGDHTPGAIFYIECLFSLFAQYTESTGVYARLVALRRVWYAPASVTVQSFLCVSVPQTTRRNIVRCSSRQSRSHAHTA